MNELLKKIRLKDASNQWSQFIFFTGIIIIIQWLDKSFVKLSSKLFPQDFGTKFFPEKAECRVRDAIFTDAAVFLLMVISAAPNVEYDNTGEKNELASLIGSFNPSWDEDGGSFLIIHSS